MSVWRDRRLLEEGVLRVLDGIVAEQEGRLMGQGRKGQGQGQQQAGADGAVEGARAHAGAHGHPGGGVRRCALGRGWVGVAALGSREQVPVGPGPRRRV